MVSSIRYHLSFLVSPCNYGLFVNGFPIGALDVPVLVVVHYLVTVGIGVCAWFLIRPYLTGHDTPVLQPVFRFMDVPVIRKRKGNFAG